MIPGVKTLADGAIITGKTDGVAVPAGKVGEYRTNSNAASAIPAGTTRNTGTLLLTKGVYLIWATQGAGYYTANPNITAVTISISTVSDTHNNAYKTIYPIPSTPAGSIGRFSTTPYVITFTSDTTWYGVATIASSGSTDYIPASLEAIRIA